MTKRCVWATDDLWSIIHVSLHSVNLSDLKLLCFQMLNRLISTLFPFHNFNKWLHHAVKALKEVPVTSNRRRTGKTFLLGTQQKLISQLLCGVLFRKRARTRMWSPSLLVRQLFIQRSWLGNRDKKKQERKKIKSERGRQKREALKVPNLIALWRHRGWMVPGGTQ